MKIKNTPILKNQFCLLAIFLGFLSCIKDRLGDTFYVEGRVLEYGTGKPVPNANVVLWSARGEFLGPVSKVVLDSVRTNEKGAFRISYTHTIDSKFLTANGSNYFQSEEVDLVNADGLKRDITLDPHAWVKVKVVHESPIGEYDRISMRYQTCTPDFIHIIEKETEIICMKPGNREHEFEYLKTPTSQAGERIKFSQYLPGHDTTEYVIQF